MFSFRGFSVPDNVEDKYSIVAEKVWRVLCQKELTLLHRRTPQAAHQAREMLLRTTLEIANQSGMSYEELRKDETIVHADIFFLERSLFLNLFDQQTPEQSPFWSRLTRQNTHNHPVRTVTPITTNQETMSFQTWLKRPKEERSTRNRSLKFGNPYLCHRPVYGPL